MEELYKEYSYLVYNHLYKICCDSSLAEELTQETFYKTMKSINKYNNKYNFSTWLCTIAKNTLIDYKRKSIDCDIFRDLFPSYINDEISNKTKMFLDNHLEECSECKSILDAMTDDIKEENNNTIKQKEINGLKKINRQIFSLKCNI